MVILGHEVYECEYQWTKIVRKKITIVYYALNVI